MRKLSAIVLLLFLCAASVLAQNATVANVYPLRIITEDQPEFSYRVPIQYELIRNQEVTSTGRVISDENSIIYLSLEEGFYELRASVDIKDTPSFDFYGETEFYITNTSSSSSNEIYMFPVGSLKVVISNNKGRALDDYPVHVGCSRTYGIQGSFTTDKFGVLTLNYLPLGNCVIRVAEQKALETTVVDIQQGERQEVYIQIRPRRNWPLFITLGLALLLLVAGSAVFIRRKQATLQQIQAKMADLTMEKDETVRTQIIEVLDEKEQEVVNKLLEEDTGKPDFYLAQSTLRWKLNMPKTTLVRVLQSLEQKGLVHIERIGKLKKIAPTNKIKGK